MIIIGLTGSIGMGKSTSAQILRDFGLPVHDSDAAVHALYAGPAVPLIEAAFPGTTAHGQVDRQKLAAQVLAAPQALKKLESLIHPLILQEREAFIAAARAAGHRAVVLDVPLLFETGADKLVDTTIVVTAEPQIQHARVMQRPNMSEEKFAAILQKQMPDAEKRQRAAFIVDTSHGLESARAQLRDILHRLGLQ